MVRAKLAISIVIVVLGLVAGLAGAYGVALWVQHSSNQNWCAALELLTSQPVTPPADPSHNPSRAAQYKLYLDFKEIERRFGC